tara:strand:- start:17576 stop:18061 length:486 start_codon:yes stop_codon:yes gene_type:complete
MKLNKQKSSTLLLMSAMCLTLSACGEFSYKRGASATDFQQEKKSCSTEYTAEADIESCLAKSGWIVVGVDKPLFAEATATATTIQTNSDDKLTIEQTLDPLELIAIGSWWKTGAAPNALIADSEQCVAELGDGHQTQNNMSLVTRGLLGCMSGKGWFALKQ